MRVVVDTNTVISALFWDGVPWQVYNAALSEQYTLLTTEALINELRSVLLRPKFAPALTAIQTTVDEIIVEYREIAEPVIPVEIGADDIRDAKDRVVLACAVGGKADYIISGDKDLLVLVTYQDIPIVKAAQFVQLLER